MACSNVVNCAARQIRLRQKLSCASPRDKFFPLPKRVVLNFLFFKVSFSLGQFNSTHSRLSTCTGKPNRPDAIVRGRPKPRTSCSVPLRIGSMFSSRVYSPNPREAADSAGKFVCLLPDGECTFVIKLLVVGERQNAQLANGNPAVREVPREPVGVRLSSPRV